VVCSYQYTGAVTAEGRVLMWGSNEHGKLGLGPKAPSVAWPTPLPPPREAAGAGGWEVSHLALGSHFAAAVTR
jgi:alpha-tubulin suppressor-like RCC1 family protein